MTTPKTTTRRTRSAKQDEAASMARTIPEVLKGVVDEPSPSTSAKAKTEAKVSDGGKIQPAKPVVEPVKVKLSTGTYDVTPRDIASQKVTAASADMIKLAEALFAVDLSIADSRVLAFLITRKSDLQQLVRADSERARKS